MDNMTAQEKAQAGVWMLKQAVLDLLSERGRMQPKEVEDELNIPSLAYGLLIEMAKKGEIEKGDGYHPPYFLVGSSRPASTH
jgi:hypothetical protein